MSSGGLGHVEIFGRVGGENLLLSRTFGHVSDLLKVLGTVFVDLGAVAFGGLHGRRQKGAQAKRNWWRNSGQRAPQRPP